MLIFCYFNKAISRTFALGLILSLLNPAKLQAAVVVYGPGHEGAGTNPSPKLAVVSPDFSHHFSVIEQGVWTKIRELFATAKSHPNTPLSRVTAEGVLRKSFL